MSNENFLNKKYEGVYLSLDGTVINWSNYETYRHFEKNREDERKIIIRNSFLEKRNNLLQETDFYFISDYVNNNSNVINYDILKDYRQFLRDIPLKYDIYNDFIDFEKIKNSFNFH